MYNAFFKPLLDRIGALVLILLFLPLMLVVAVLIYFSLGRPVLFSQQRPGLHGTIFTIYKFRTMSDARDADGNLLPDDERVYGVGKTVRSLSLDELPQLFNVLKGDMSFIGPRPLLREYLPLYNTRQKQRHNVKPGITGWAQVNGRNAISWEEKFEFDVWYTEHASLLLDCKIAFMTVKKVLVKEGISAEGQATVGRFEGTKE